MKQNNGPSIYNIGKSTTSSTGSTVMNMMSGNNNNGSTSSSTTSTTANSGIQYLIILILLFPIVSFIIVYTYSSTILMDPVFATTKADGKGSIDNDLFSQFTKSDNTGTGTTISNQQQKQQSATSTTTTITDNKIVGGSTLAGLSCIEHGGPDDEKIASEMVYWQDIPTDAIYKSQLKHPSIEQYITFEPDPGGWNNIRMAMETVLGMAFAMGRTLVLPPEKEFYLLGNKEHVGHGKSQNTTFTFANFFHMSHIQEEHKYGTGVRIISMTEYLQTVAISGQLKDKITGTISYPPQNKRTNWDGEKNVHILFDYLRSVSYIPIDWDPESCLAVFPSTRSIDDIDEIQVIRNEILNSGKPLPKYEDYIDKPVPINASTIERMKESWASRKDVCVYNTTMQNEQYIHFVVDHTSESRLLTHFYTFLFFTSYNNDLWMKRFIRDHVRYMDNIQCAAARVIYKVRERAIRRDPIHNPTGVYDAIHVRRGDFQYKATRIDNIQLLQIIQRKIPIGSSVFIATDERDKTYFRPLMEQYHIMFLDEFISTELSTMNSNYFGMIDALITTKSRTFYGCWFSTFTGYINRIRGYHHDKAKLPGYEMGLINSYYYALPDRFDHMRHYYPIKRQFYAREFPAAWRLIDTTVPDQ